MTLRKPDAPKLSVAFDVVSLMGDEYAHLMAEGSQVALCGNRRRRNGPAEGWMRPCQNCRRKLAVASETFATRITSTHHAADFIA